MPKAKNERNLQFIKAWKEEGLTGWQLQERFSLSEGGMRALKARLRGKDHSLYKKVTASKDAKVTSTSTATPDKVKPERKKEATSTQTSTSTSTKRMTFWLPEAMIDKIKVLAAKEKRTASDILREILGQYLKGK
mgnify:CR=1 FL=1